MKKYLSIFLLIIIAAVQQKAQCQSLYVNSGFYVSGGALVTVKGALQTGVIGAINNKGSISVTGNITNNGKMTDSLPGTYTLSGSNGASSINGNNNIGFYNVVFDNINGFSITTPISVKNNTSFLNGILNYTPATPFLFAKTSSYTGVSNSSHIKGIVSKEGLTTFIFPVGDGTKTKRVAVDSINPASVSGTTFTVAYHTAPLNDAGNVAAPLSQLSDKEYWTVNSNSGSTASLSFEYDPAGYTADFAGNNSLMRLGYDDNGTWTEKGNYSTAFFANAVQTNPAVSKWGDFTIAKTRGLALVATAAQSADVVNQKAASLPGSPSIKAWPNPAPGYFFVQNLQTANALPLDIFDAGGKPTRHLVLQPQQQQRIAQLMPGMYFVKGGGTTLKVLVQ